MVSLGGAPRTHSINTTRGATVIILIVPFFFSFLFCLFAPLGFQTDWEKNKKIKSIAILRSRRTIETMYIHIRRGRNYTRRGQPPPPPPAVIRIKIINSDFFLIMFSTIRTGNKYIYIYICYRSAEKICLVSAAVVHVACFYYYYY